MAHIQYADLPEEAAAILPVYVIGVGTDVKQEAFARPDLRHPQLILTRSGAGTAWIGKEHFSLTAGALLLVDGGIPCSFEPTGKNPWIVDWLSFDYGFALLHDKLFRNRKAVCGMLTAPDSLHESFAEVHLGIERDTRYGKYMASAYLYKMLVDLYVKANHGLKPVETGVSVLNLALDYIAAHYTEDIPFADLCAAAGGVSKQYLCRIFKNNTGLRPVEFIMRSRIAAARSMLERSEASIADVAEAVGFRNTSYFYRTFKKFTGISPNAYRQTAEDTDQ